jgi:hypothetical protein
MRPVGSTGGSDLVRGVVISLRLGFLAPQLVFAQALRVASLPGVAAFVLFTLAETGVVFRAHERVVPRLRRPEHLQQSRLQATDRPQLGVS